MRSPQRRSPENVERCVFSSKWLPARARLHEYQGKEILAANGFKIPRGRAANSPDEAVAAAKELSGGDGAEVVIKIQARTTGRAGIGGVAFAKEPEDVPAHPARTRSASSRPFLTIHIK